MQEFDLETADRKRIHGSNCLYFLYVLGNLALLMEGFGIIVVGMFLCFETHSFDWFNASFIFIGFVTILLAYMGCQTRYSTCKIIMYTILLFPLLITQLSFSIALFFYNDQLSKIIASHGPSQNYEQLKKDATQYAQDVEIFLLTCSAIQIYCIVSACLYRSSLSDQKFYTEFKNKLKQRKKEYKNIQSQEKRELLYQKYPNLSNKF